MKRFAGSLVRQGIKAPAGYKTSISICRKFLNEHAPKKGEKADKADGETNGKPEPKPVSEAQLSYARKIAHGKGLVIPDEAKASSAAMSEWIDLNRDRKRRGRKMAYKSYGSSAPRSARPTRRLRSREANADSPGSQASLEGS
jgi:DNA topoisomerase-3